MKFYITIFLFLSLMLFTAEGQLQRLQYNNPGLVVDLGVGLWAWPMPMDWDSDGDLYTGSPIWKLSKHW